MSRGKSTSSTKKVRLSTPADIPALKSLQYILFYTRWYYNTPYFTVIS